MDQDAGRRFAQLFRTGGGVRQKSEFEVKIKNRLFLGSGIRTHNISQHNWCKKFLRVRLWRSELTETSKFVRKLTFTFFKKMGNRVDVEKKKCHDLGPEILFFSITQHSRRKQIMRIQPKRSELPETHFFKPKLALDKWGGLVCLCARDPPQSGKVEQVLVDGD